MAIYIGPRPG